MTIKIIFNNSKHLPEDLRAHLSELAENRLLQTFGNEAAMRAAFEEHNKHPQPDDAVQTALEVAEIEVQRYVTPLYGPTTASGLRPWVHFYP